jgi:hypothetical protein
MQVLNGQKKGDVVYLSYSMTISEVEKCQIGNVYQNLV